MTPELDERLAAALDGADVDALIDVGCDLADLDRQDEALACFERAVALGEESMWFNVGNTLRELDRPLEAVDAYQRAVAAGQTDAWLNLGAVLERLGDLAGAMGAYRAAWDSGAQPDGYVNLAHLLREQGLAEDAEARLAEAAERDHPPAAALLACWQWERTADPALEERLRAGAAVDGDARVCLAELLVATGRRGEARAQLELGAKLGQSQCWLPLGNVLCGDDLADELDVSDAGVVDEAAAEEAYRAGIAAGDLYCHHNLAVLLLARGDTAGADAHLLAGAAGGDGLAERAWQELHRGGER
ncbi:tetratricopeptide repeat protein [Kineococcus sp. DHX-1]|uniref:tetratricopeptide repeat protein n=1 Tax=Kineococcus sp. DHX-1 TaxID=3349638 RepID=UPI0036D27AF0